MNYIELDFDIGQTEDYQKDILIDNLAQIGFDTFEDTETGFKAFIKSDDFVEELVHSLLAESGLVGSFTKTIIEQKNWNEVWESNFEPLHISDDCYVRATFHKPHPKYRFEIVIDPKMAFGTGHHQTTTLMMQILLNENCLDKTILDMGCGTGILAILASKMGAKQLHAIDNDEVCYQSVIDNCSLNHADNIYAICGSKEVIPNEKYDIILANINRNILLDQLPDYKEHLKPGGLLYLSGFYKTDLTVIEAAANNNSLSLIAFKELDNWVAAKFTANN